MIILGIDPGLAITGYGLIKVEGHGYVHLAHGVIRTAAGTLPGERLYLLNKKLSQLIKTYRPSRAAVQMLFMSKNVKTAIQVGEARGVILLTLAKAKVPVVSFTPLQIKQAITAYGRADKNQMQKMVQAILGLKALPVPDDAADGLAAAICCAQTKL